MGWLTDRVGGRKVISFFCLFLGGGAFFMGKAQSLFGAATSYGIVGIGSAAMWVPSATLIQKWFGTKKRGFALGILNASSGMGFGVMGLLLPAIAINCSWRFGWSVLGIVALTLFIVNGLLLRDQPENMGLLPYGEKIKGTRDNSFTSKTVNRLKIFKQSQLWIIGISYFLISYGSYALIDFIVAYGKMELNIPYGIASLFITVIAFSGIPGGILMMILSDYIGTKKSLVIIYVLFAFSILLIIFGGSQVSIIMVALAWFGFLYGAIFPVVAACARDYLPKEVTGTALGLLTIFYGIGAMSTPILTGYLADVTGTFRWSFGLGGLAALIAAVVIGFLKKPKEFGHKGD
jgi:sugar phosphate permease